MVFKFGYNYLENRYNRINVIMNTIAEPIFLYKLLIRKIESNIN